MHAGIEFKCVPDGGSPETCSGPHTFRAQYFRLLLLLPIVTSIMLIRRHLAQVATRNDPITLKELQ